MMMSNLVASLQLTLLRHCCSSYSEPSLLKPFLLNFHLKWGKCHGSKSNGKGASMGTEEGDGLPIIWGLGKAFKLWHKG